MYNRFTEYRKTPQPQLNFSVAGMTNVSHAVSYVFDRANQQKCRLNRSQRNRGEKQNAATTAEAAAAITTIARHSAVWGLPILVGGFYGNCLD